ncbi:hypothetical protein PAXRUDRAFT_9099 [Paxillus rubicundulus Ve08.2h10]|uniref:G domain-containing protein n=1 Tax=Paxillus rubicundulus Ve08.2h10 TaxID=930991 RepID=A0A0D0ECB7_9AGAM|nr:hypothetical protein PAXRUDRAFT_9099 [Paxillus rubicundulus Ve08.2h10]
MSSADNQSNLRPKSIYNILVVVEARVGKGSLINLVLGSTKAKTGNGVGGLSERHLMGGRKTILRSRLIAQGEQGAAFTSWYFACVGLPGSRRVSSRCIKPSSDLTLDNKSIRVFETSGLEESRMDVSGYLAAIEKAYRLILSLSKAGGVHLLLFCTRRDGMTAAEQSNYWLFCEFVCNKKVPVALVVTGLERETVMEDWWRRNESNARGTAFTTEVRDIGKDDSGAPGELRSPGQCLLYGHSQLVRRGEED